MELGLQLLALGRLRFELSRLPQHHLGRHLLENPQMQESGRQARENTVLDVVAQNGLLVLTANSAETVDRQTLLVIGAAVTVLCHDRIWAAVFGAFEDTAQEIAGAQH